jgi:hypothetical protein
MKAETSKQLITGYCTYCHSQNFFETYGNIVCRDCGQQSPISRTNEMTQTHHHRPELCMCDECSLYLYERLLSRRARQNEEVFTECAMTNF